MKNYVLENFGFLITTAVVFIILPIRELESLFCHKCMAMACEGEGDVCESVRDYTSKELRAFYYIGKYLEECPEPDNAVEWRQREFSNTACDAAKASEATCTLGRIRVTTQLKDKTIISHATILGCANRELLKALTQASLNGKCNSDTTNGTEASYQHFLEVEHCPQLSDYCHTVDYCVLPEMSVVKSYKSQAKDTSFEYGAIIGIIVGIVVLFAVIIAASMCRSPLNRTSNYSPTQVQANSNGISPSTTNSNMSSPA